MAAHPGSLCCRWAQKQLWRSRSRTTSRWPSSTSTCELAGPSGRQHGSTAWSLHLASPCQSFMQTAMACCVCLPAPRSIHTICNTLLQSLVLPSEGPPSGSWTRMACSGRWGLISQTRPLSSLQPAAVPAALARRPGGRHLERCRCVSCVRLYSAARPAAVPTALSHCPGTHRYVSPCVCVESQISRHG